jgi:Gpi18-like mannosyltransferase
MKKLLQIILKPALLVATWLLILGTTVFFATRNSPEISFPYYNTDLANNYSQIASVPAHFDGIHYLRIARYGYKDVGTQAFFPLYPILIRALTPFTPSPLFAGVLISIISLIIAFIGLRRLFPTSLHPIPYLLLFPTSFFFLALYTESLFLALSIWFFLMLKQKRWLLAAIIAAFASGTRLVGSLLAVSLVIEYLTVHKLRFRLPLIPLTLVSLSGFILYTLYLNQEFSDPLMFVHVQSMFGANRTTDSLIMLPQVIYRYLKMFLTVPFFSTLSARIYLEFASFIGASYLLIKYWRSRTHSLNSYLTLSLILPTLTGTLSSVPRYILILLPFILPDSTSLRTRIITQTLSLVFLVYFLSQFALGIFVA